MRRGDPGRQVVVAQPDGVGAETAQPVEPVGVTSDSDHPLDPELGLGQLNRQ